MSKVSIAPSFEVLKTNFCDKYSEMTTLERDSRAVVRYKVPYTFKDIWQAVKDEAEEAPFLLEDLWSLDQKV